MEKIVEKFIKYKEIARKLENGSREQIAIDTMTLCLLEHLETKEEKNDTRTN